jgi:predicted ATPase
MIHTITIQNYKSIQNVTLELGRVNVLIGANGEGKSNILEAVALGTASVSNKLDNEFLVSRGIRVTKPIFMRSAFKIETTEKPIKLSITSDKGKFDCSLTNDNLPYSKWRRSVASGAKSSASVDLYKSLKAGDLKTGDDISEEQVNRILDYSENLPKISDYIIYSPENSALRVFQREGQIEPLGVNGEGLLKLLWVIDRLDDKGKINDIKDLLFLVDWFDNFEIPQNLLLGDNLLNIKDRYVDVDLKTYTQKSANEGFLFLLFYAALFVSDDTPKFFAIDNIDASLNPKLCTRLIKELVKLAKKYDKQVIMTTHNPAVLDGLNLDDPEQKLMVVSRNKQGHTKIKTVQKPRTLNGEEPVKLSEAFMNGMIGGLPKSF